MEHFLVHARKQTWLVRFRFATDMVYWVHCMSFHLLWILPFPYKIYMHQWAMSWLMFMLLYETFMWKIVYCYFVYFFLNRSVTDFIINNYYVCWNSLVLHSKINIPECFIAKIKRDDTSIKKNVVNHILSWLHA